MFSRSAVTSLNWGSNPILTFPNVPEVSIDLIDRPHEVPWGAGKPTTSVMPSVIANGIFDATACGCGGFRSGRPRSLRR